MRGSGEEAAAHDRERHRSVHRRPGDGLRLCALASPSPPAGQAEGAMIDRDVFFARVREAPFGGVMRQGQVDGCNAILDAWEARAGFVDRRWLAYMLATAKWETAHTMQPIEEIGQGHGRPYGVPTVDGRVFYGRGYVQLTWATNYAKMAALTGTDLVGYP